MKKLWVVLLALCVMVSISAFAQDTGKAGKTTKSASSEPKAPLKSLTGTIGQDGKTFTNDADQKSWDIMNPDAVKGHEGHHVKVSAHVYADKNQIHVMKVAMVGEKGAKKGAKAKGGEKM